MNKYQLWAQKFIGNVMKVGVFCAVCVIPTKLVSHGEQ